MKIFSNINKRTVVITESQARSLMAEGIKVATAKDKDATKHSMQKEFDKVKKCPKCGADMPFLMSVYDDCKKNSEQQIGKVEDGKWHETECQAFGIWQCPECSNVEAESNMA